MPTDDCDRDVKVYHRDTMPHGIRKVVVLYGDPLSGRIIYTATIMEPPRNEREHGWIEHGLAVRIAPGGSIRHAYSGAVHGD